MNWRVVIVAVVSAFVSQEIAAQANILNAKKPEEIGLRTEAQKAADNDKPLPYGYVDDRDILWSKTVWEVIDLNERINFPLLYPIDTIDMSSDRRSYTMCFLRTLKMERLKTYM